MPADDNCVHVQTIIVLHTLKINECKWIWQQ